MKRSRGGERGFTFLLVVWALAILSMLALVFGSAVATHLKTSRNAVDNARAEAFADAGIALASMDLVAWRAQPTRAPRFPRDGRPARCSLGGDDWLAVAIEDEAGKVDLNAAGDRLLAAALMAAGVAEDEAARLAERLIDYRDSDEARHPDGAEAADYRDAGRAGPKNEPLDTIEEVEQVLGVPAGLADALRPYATVYSGQSTVDARAARRRLLSGLSGESAMAGAESGGFDNMPAAASGFVSGAGAGRVFRVLAQARTIQGAVFVREAIVEFVAATGGAFVFRRWRRGDAPVDDGAAVVPAGLPVC
jgi:general secretion pathway protein K